MMQLLSKEFDVSINELISGEKLIEENYKEKAEENLIEALENSSFTLKDKIAFYEKKWLKEHVSSIVLNIVAWIAVIIALIFQHAEGYLIGTVASMLAFFFYAVRRNQMMIYIEDRVYQKIEKSNKKHGTAHFGCCTMLLCYTLTLNLVFVSNPPWRGYR